MPKTLFVYNLWWAFGSNLLNTKWAMIHAVKNGYEFFYKYNFNKIFPGGSIEFYFEPISTIAEKDLKEEELVQYLLIKDTLPSEERYSYKPDHFNSVEDFHQDLMKKIYKPNERVRSFIDNNNLICKLRSENKGYIGVHIRLGDKIAGPDKETDYIDLNVYMNACLAIRRQTNLNTIVICSDTNEAIEIMHGYNEQLDEKFEMYWNEEKRCSNNWQDSLTHRVNCNLVEQDELVSEYFTCFINFQLLLEASILVGNFDSGFILAAVEYRNNGYDVNVNTKNPPMWKGAQINREGNITF